MECFTQQQQQQQLYPITKHEYKKGMNENKRDRNSQKKYIYKVFKIKNKKQNMMHNPLKCY